MIATVPKGSVLRRLPWLFLTVMMLAWMDSPAPLFRLLPATRTGIDFSNTLFETDSLNILNEAYIYNGGGVGVGDFNNDGLPDLYFSANMSASRMYLNTGKLSFRDITKSAGVDGGGRWCSGVSVIDINADGWLDLYLCTTFYKDPSRRQNLLYINQGGQPGGIPVFKESAASYGLADTGYSTQGIFLDYDMDGDLDMYLLTNALDPAGTPIRYREKITDGSAANTDRLYRNNGNQTFTDVSKAAGITIEGWGHGVSVSDINLDGWPDLYVTNDFVANDILYINNRNGTFTDQVGSYLKHTSWYAMGNDMADINNDGLIDLVTLDMLPEDNPRKKSMLRGNEYYNYFNNKKYNYQHQYIRNSLQLNQGIGPAGHPVFSEAGYMSGIYQTDWSWSPMLVDLDNDGLRDLVISNGLPRDVTDLDYIEFDNGQGANGGATSSTLEMVKSLPVVKIPNYAFRNTGAAGFQNETRAWGLSRSSFSNGSAYADLDNDGDMDLVINNINETAFVYENTLNNEAGVQAHHLSVQLRGPRGNPGGLGATIRVYYNGDKQQVYEQQPCRGYQSTVDARAHFGLGSTRTLDSLRVRWPGGRSQLLKNIAADKPLLLNFDDSEGQSPAQPARGPAPLLERLADNGGIKYMAAENDFVDYNVQSTLPHKLSQSGPGIAVGDIDKNGYDDFYIGGSAGIAGRFFMQAADGRFTGDSTRIADIDHPQEETGVLLFDADSDGDLDLYMASGSYQFSSIDLASRDRLYVNDGSGHFTRDVQALPKDFANGSCVRAADFDQDGDLDLFVGGRGVSGAYPTPGESFIYQNNQGRFEDITARIAPALGGYGMVTDALWSDFDQDGKTDLVVTAEWKPIGFFRNTGDSLVPVSERSGIAQHTGWWNSLAAGDFDNDGDIDYLAGNLGLNSNFKASPAEPMHLFARDLDDNGLLDPMIFCYAAGADGQRKPYPMHTRDDLVTQMISIRKRYPTYKKFGVVMMDDLWSLADRKQAIALVATTMQSAYIENKGAGHFALTPLPAAAQLAPVFGMVTDDVNNDGKLDLLLSGNDFGMEPFSGRHDAFNGVVLLGNGKGGFAAMELAAGGLYIPGDGKALARIDRPAGGPLYVATQNQDSVLAFGQRAPSSRTRTINLGPLDCSAIATYANNRKQRLEFYHGSGYLSQSSRRVTVDETMSRLEITDYSGKKRNVPLH